EDAIAFDRTDMALHARPDDEGRTGGFRLNHLVTLLDGGPHEDGGQPGRACPAAELDDPSADAGADLDRERALVVRELPRVDEALLLAVQIDETRLLADGDDD